MSYQDHLINNLPIREIEVDTCASNIFPKDEQIYKNKNEQQNKITLKSVEQINRMRIHKRVTDLKKYVLPGSSTFLNAVTLVNFKCSNRLIKITKPSYCTFGGI
jgi:hypothetical protein